MSTDGGSTWTTLTNTSIYSGVASATLTITGVPAGINNYQYECVATSSLGTAVSASAAVTVASAPPVITSATTATATQNNFFSYTIIATNSPSGFDATGLPSGLALNTTTGVISGTPSGSGAFTINLTATNTGGASYATLALMVNPTAPNITSASIATATQNSAFSYAITATNQPSSYSASDLPIGLSLNTATGAISGAAWVAGTYNVTVGASNISGTGTASLVITVYSGTPVISSANSAILTQNSAFSYSITASNSPISYGTTVLPAGLSLNSATGVISGTPLTSGSYVVIVSATNASGTGSANLSLTNNLPSPSITSATNAALTRNTPFTYSITATNSPTSFSTTALPAGLSLNGATGVISGTPTANGTFPVAISATNASGTGSATLIFTINLPIPSITSAASAMLTRNTPFTYSITATNSPTSYSTTALPAGLSLNGATGVISGTPTVNGTFPVAISATNASGTGSATLIFTINLPLPSITSAASAILTQNAPSTYSITATNSPTSYSTTALPAGLALNGATGVISGTATVNGTFPVAISATNASGTGSATLIFTINLPIPSITSATSATLTQNAPSTYTITATNSPTSFSTTALPAGLALNAATGVISGIPTANGSFPVTISASNVSGTSSVFLTLAINPPVPSITSATNVTITKNVAFAYSITATNSPTSYSTSTLPAGLSLNSATGVISGSPTSSGSFTAIISAINVSGTGSAFLSFTSNSPTTPSITSPTSAALIQNVPFSYAITATNSPTSYGTSALPAGLSLNSVTGVISGTPTTVGTFMVTVSANNASGTASIFLTLTIDSLTPSITSPASATITQNVSFTYAITATHSPASYSTSTLPAGLSLNPATGIISGAPAVAGTTNILINATNGSGTGSAVLQLTVTSGAPVISSPATAAGAKNSAFSYSIAATNSPTSFGVTALPGGLSVNPSTGLISGIPTSVGTVTITINATNSLGTGSAQLTFNIAPSTASAPVISSPAAAAATTGNAFSYSILGSNTPTSFGAAGLPAGLSVSTSTGVISGTPTAAGVFSVTISATNSVGTTSLNLTITVSTLAPVITSPSSVAGTLNALFSPGYTISATNGPTSFSSTGLPPGLTVNTSTGAITGIPTAAGSFTATITAVNSAGSGSSLLILIINQVPFTGVYFGTFTNGGNWALYVRPDNSGVFIAAVNGTPVTQNVTINSDGSFTISTTGASALSTARDRFAAIALPISISGHISNGTVSGSAGSTALNGSQDLGTSTSSLTGFYSGTGLLGTAGGSYAIVGGDGQVLVVAVNGTSTETSIGMLNANGTFSGSTADGGTVSLTINAQGQATTSLTPSGSNTLVRYLGLSTSVASTTRLVNLSARATAGTGSDILTVGFVVSGGTKEMLVRGIGPSLAGFGITGCLKDPELSLYASSSLIQSNDIWEGDPLLSNAFAQVGAFALSRTSNDSALLTALPAGTYTAQVSSASGSSGVALAEFYDEDTGTTPAARIVNLSSSATVDSNGRTLVAGFVIAGNAPETVLIRGIGPTLARFGISGALAKPQLTLFDVTGNSLATNSGWGGSSALAGTFVQVGAFALAADSNDAAILITLAPGTYSAQVTGLGGSAGVGMVEVFEVR